MTEDVLDVIQDELAGVLSRVERRTVDDFVSTVDNAHRIFVAGAGRSGFMGEAFAMRLVHMGLTVHVVGEATAPTMTAGDVLVALSGSGTTSGTVRTAEQAVRAEATVVAVTTDPESPLARESALVLHLAAATKYRRADEASSIQPLSSLFDQAVHLVLDAVCLRLAAVRDVDNAAAKRAHVTTE